jgi:hypothetical protein
MKPKNKKCVNLGFTHFRTLLNVFLWCERDLNPRHMDFQSIALPTELSHRFQLGCKYRTFIEKTKNTFISLKLRVEGQNKLGLLHYFFIFVRLSFKKLKTHE